jgi:predicted dehydrogenase
MSRNNLESSPAGPVGLGLVGLGYWGPNLLRVASELEDVEVRSLCDLDVDRVAAQRRRVPLATTTQRFDDVLEDDAVHAVLIATPIATHHELARRALMAGKHVLVEKPMASTGEACRELAELAAERGLTVMPGHTFLYSPPVLAIKEMLDREKLGDLHFITSTRVNLGIHQSDASVVQDLAPHDFSILAYWLGVPVSVRAVARDSIVPGVWDVAFIDLAYAGGTLVRVELSWLAPTKLRRMVLAGRRAMVVYDDTSNEQVRVFDYGVEVVEPGNFGEYQLAYRVGDILSPHLGTDEPLRLELADFVASIRSGRSPRSDARIGSDVVRMVEATEASLAHNGAPVWLDAPPGERRRVPDRRRALMPMPPVEDEPPASALELSPLSD